MDMSISCECFVSYRSLRRADHSCRGVLSSVVCLEYDHKASVMRRPCHTRGCCAIGKGGDISLMKQQFVLTH
jgi:hypothetical protein